MKNSGIYIVKNIITGEFYLGSAHNFNKRKWRHFSSLKHSKHHSIVLQRAYDKYGKNSFVFEPIFHCLPDDCIKFENHFLTILAPRYNIAKDAVAPMAGRKHSEETKLKFRAVKRPSGKECYQYGTTWSDETRAKIMAKQVGSKRSEETKQKMSDTAKRINSIGRIDRTKAYKSVIDNDGIIYKSASDAAKLNGVSVQTICDILKGRHSKTRQKKSFKYYNGNNN